MRFDDVEGGEHRWSRGPIGLLAAGLAHLLATVLQILLMGAFALFLAVDANPPPPAFYVVVGVCGLLPGVVSVGVSGLLLLAARRLRDHGPDGVVTLALVAGVFWPMARMGLGVLTCSFFDLATQMLPAIATLVAGVLVASDGATARTR